MPSVYRRRHTGIQLAILKWERPLTGWNVFMERRIRSINSFGYVILAMGNEGKSCWFNTWRPTIEPFFCGNWAIFIYRFNTLFSVVMTVNHGNKLIWFFFFQGQIILQGILRSAHDIFWKVVWTDEQLDNFRREVDGKGILRYRDSCTLVMPD